MILEDQIEEDADEGVENFECAECDSDNNMMKPESSGFDT